MKKYLFPVSTIWKLLYPFPLFLFAAIQLYKYPDLKFVRHITTFTVFFILYQLLVSITLITLMRLDTKTKNKLKKLR